MKTFAVHMYQLYLDIMVKSTLELTIPVTFKKHCILASKPALLCGLKAGNEAVL